MALELLVNGERRSVPEGTTVAGLLQQLGVRADLAAVERNGEVVPRRQHGEAVLQVGDVIEVVTFVGGG
jgi:sulfur carrier protein